MISEGQLVIKDRSHAFIAPGADDCVTFNRASRRSGGGECLVWKKRSPDINGCLIIVTFLWWRHKKTKQGEDCKHQSTDDSDILVLFIYFYSINILNYLILSLAFNCAF